MGRLWTHDLHASAHTYTQVLCEKLVLTVRECSRMAHALPAEKRRVVMVDYAAQRTAVAKAHGKVIDLMTKRDENSSHACGGKETKEGIRSERR